MFEKASFRNLIKRQRILVPANGFYEWQKQPSGGKQAYYLNPASAGAMFIGGIYQHVHDGDSDACLLTTAANEWMAPLHDRMPVLVRADEAMAWLTDHQRESVLEKMKAPAEDALSALPVSDFVNSSRHDGPTCIEPINV